MYNTPSNSTTSHARLAEDMRGSRKESSLLKNRPASYLGDRHENTHHLSVGTSHCAEFVGAVFSRHHPGNGNRPVRESGDRGDGESAQYRYGAGAHDYDRSRWRLQHPRTTGRKL